MHLYSHKENKETKCPVCFLFLSFSFGGRVWIGMCWGQMLILEYLCTDCISPILLKRLNQNLMSVLIWDHLSMKYWIGMCWGQMLILEYLCNDCIPPILLKRLNQLIWWQSVDWDVLGPNANSWVLVHRLHSTNTLKFLHFLSCEIMEEIMMSTFTTEIRMTDEDTL